MAYQQFRRIRQRRRRANRLGWALVSLVVVGFAALGGWIAWRPAADDSALRFDPLTAAQLAGILERFAQYLAPARV